MDNVSTTHDRHPDRGNGHGPELTPVTPAEDARTVLINRISWGAVLAGVAIALISQVLLNMLGVGVGASAVNPTAPGGTPAADAVTTAAGVWYAVSGIIAAFIGGLAAGRLSGQPDYNSAAWHGLTTWAVTTLAIVWLLTTTVSALVGGTFQMLGNVAGQAAQGATQAAGAAVAAVDPLSRIENRVRAAGGDRSAQLNEAIADIRSLLVAPQQQQAPIRERAIQTLAQVQGIPVEQARSQVAQYEQQYREFLSQTQQTATQAAGTATRAVSWTAILGVIALALGALAGWFGGRVGAVDPTITPMARLREAVPRRLSRERERPPSVH